MVLAIVKTMKNPRSAVLKTSVMVCTDVFNALGNLISTAVHHGRCSIARMVTTKEQTTRHFASYDTRTGAGVWRTKVGSNINVAPEHGLQLLKFLNSIERTLGMFCCEHITEIDSV